MRCRESYKCKPQTANVKSEGQNGSVAKPNDSLRGVKVPGSRVIFENKTEVITYTLDGHLLHTHKTNFVQRYSLDTWPDFESAKKAVETDLRHVRWSDPE
jgi:hypothetical protein